MSQCRPSGVATGRFGKRATISVRTRPPSIAPTTTRPLVAPRSTATTVPMTTQSAKERCCDAGVDRNVEACGLAEVLSGQHGHGGGDVLGENFALEDRALCVEGAELLLGNAVGLGALRAPSAGEYPGSAHDAVRVHAVDADAVLAELYRQKPHLVRLIGLGRGISEVVRPGEHRVLGRDIDDVASH